MKTRCFLAGAVGAAGLIVLSVTPVGAADPADTQAEFVDPNSAEAQHARNLGSYAIDRLVMTMITDSAKVVADRSEAEALPKMHLKGIPMTGGFIGGIRGITALKLTSLKLCNPKNAPDEAEKLALANVQAGLENGTPPNILVQKVALPTGIEWRVYKPLAAIRQCGSCHGDPDAQSPELKAALHTHFPDNAATGYRRGEWRGVIRVTVTDPAAAAAKPSAPAKKQP